MASERPAPKPGEEWLWGRSRDARPVKIDRVFARGFVQWVEFTTQWDFVTYERSVATFLRAAKPGGGDGGPRSREAAMASRDSRERFLTEMFPGDPLAAQAYEAMLDTVRAEGRREAMDEAARIAQAHVSDHASHECAHRIADEIRDLAEKGGVK